MNIHTYTCTNLYTYIHEKMDLQSQAFPSYFAGPNFLKKSMFVEKLAEFLMSDGDDMVSKKENHSCL